MSFTPFIESQTPFRVVAATSGLDTSAIDRFRQGVEISPVSAKRFLGSSPKMGSGNADHSFLILNYGFSIGFDDQNSGSAFSDNEKFNPVKFLLNEQTQTYPILLNGGVAGWLDAVLQPLTIPYRTKESIPEVPFFAHRITAKIMPSASGFELYETLSGISAFKDSGAYTIGNVRVEGIVGELENGIRPYDDSNQQPILNDCAASTDLMAILQTMSLNLNGDLRPFNARSTTKGFVYGQYNANVGTDSIAFGDRKR
jgi:hypothetical protein